MRKLLVALMVLALSIPSLASALTYSRTVSDLAGWTNIGNSSIKNTFVADAGATAVKYTGNIYGQTVPEPSTGYVMIGQNFNTPLNLSAFSDYALHIYNVNESIWNYSLYAQDSYGYTAVSLPFLKPITEDADAILTLDLAANSLDGLNLADITSIGFWISQKVPIPTGDPMGDRTYETIVAPVPEPGTMILLGAGFLGLAIYGKRRKNA